MDERIMVSSPARAQLLLFHPVVLAVPFHPIIVILIIGQDRLMYDLPGGRQHLLPQLLPDVGWT